MSCVPEMSKLRSRGASLLQALRRALFLLSAAIALGGTAASMAATAPSALPLVQQSDITYLGAFALPSWANGNIGASSFEYGGHAVTPYTDPSTGKSTLFMEGHAQKPGNVAQVEIPSTFVKSTTWSALPMAKTLQPFADVADGKMNALDLTNLFNPIFVYGLLPFNGRLIVGASSSYSSTQTTSHGVSNLTLSSSGDFKGWYAFSASAPSRALGGPMAPIPAEWQSSFGGPALTGQCCISVTGSTSAGFSLTVFNPDDVGVKSPIPGTTVLFYSLDHPQCGALHCEATQNSNYNLTTVYGGMAFIPGTRTVLFVGAMGTGPYCYGSASDCGNDSALLDVKGPHAQPYRYQVWAYDANDLIAVKNGSKQAYQPQPYAIWSLDGMPYSGNDKIKGAGYDPATGRLYVTQDYGTNPRVEVYQVGKATAAVSPNPPTGLAIQ